MTTQYNPRFSLDPFATEDIETLVKLEWSLGLDSSKVSVTNFLILMVVLRLCKRISLSKEILGILEVLGHLVPNLISNSSEK